MTNNDLSTSTATVPQGADLDPFAHARKPKRREVIGATVTEDEKANILRALGQAGFANQAQGSRVVLMAFQECARVRDAVADWFQQNVDRAA